MNDETWQKLTEKISGSFPGARIYQEDLVDEQSGEIQGSCDVAEFSNAAGRFRLVRENRPLLLEKKMHYSHRQGESARTEYVFSDTELSHKLLVFREDQDGDWQKLNLGDLNLV